MTAYLLAATFEAEILSRGSQRRFSRGRECLGEEVNVTRWILGIPAIYGLLLGDGGSYIPSLRLLDFLFGTNY